MPPQPEPPRGLAAGSPRATAFVANNFRSGVSLPLGPPAVMTTCLTAMAPCQVSSDTVLQLITAILGGQEKKKIQTKQKSLCH